MTAASATITTNRHLDGRLEIMAQCPEPDASRQGKAPEKLSRWRIVL